MDNEKDPAPDKVILLKDHWPTPDLVGYLKMLDRMQSGIKREADEIREDPFPTIQAMEYEIDRLNAVIESIKEVIWPAVVRIEPYMTVEYPEPVDADTEAMRRLDRIERILINED